MHAVQYSMSINDNITTNLLIEMNLKHTSEAIYRDVDVVISCQVTHPTELSLCALF